MALVPKTVSKTVGTTAASLFATGVQPRAIGTVVFTAPSSNTGVIYIGQEGVVDHATGVGIAIAAGAQVIMNFPDNMLIDLSSFWADATDADEKLHITYMEKAL